MFECSRDFIAGRISVRKFNKVGCRLVEYETSPESEFESLEKSGHEKSTSSEFRIKKFEKFGDSVLEL